MKQPSGGSAAVVQVTDPTGATNYYKVNSDGSVCYGTCSGGDLTIGRVFYSLYGDLLDQGADPAAPAANHVILYNKGGALFSRNSGGTITSLGGGAGAPALDAVTAMTTNRSLSYGDFA